MQNSTIEKSCVLLLGVACMILALCLGVERRLRLQAEVTSQNWQQRWRESFQQISHLQDIYSSNGLTIVTVTEGYSNNGSRFREISTQGKLPVIFSTPNGYDGPIYGRIIKPPAKPDQ